ncbi:MAG: AAA family ATPase, partial [bacterium]
MKKLPIGISDFKKLIKGDYIYVDKTKYIYELVESGGYIFLSRPRRFGKSLLLSTIKYLFEGQKELFKNLFIYDKWNWEEKYPVIRISFAADIKNIDSFYEVIHNQLKLNYEKFNILFQQNFKHFDLLLENLILNVYKKFNQQIVLLVDEYDKPILDLITDKKEAEEVRKELKSFYSVLKELDQYLKFVFIT